MDASIGNKINDKLLDVKGVLESMDPEEMLPGDIEYVRDSLVTRIIGIQGIISELQRIGIW